MYFRSAPEGPEVSRSVCPAQRQTAAVGRSAVGLRLPAEPAATTDGLELMASVYRPSTGRLARSGFITWLASEPGAVSVTDRASCPEIAMNQIKM